MRFAARMDRMQDKGMLTMMEMADREDIIKFSGGFPSPATYPYDQIKECFYRVLEQDAEGALSYGSTSGFTPLREHIAARMRKKFDLDCTVEEVIVTNGSQQALDLTGLLFVDKGDVILFETPSYLGALNALKSYEADMVAVPTDSEGICVDELKKTLDKYGDRVKLIYVIPDFQNPSGRCWSDERRRAFMELVQQYDVAVLEDAAYSELAFSGVKHLSLLSMDKNHQVAYCGTFSKVFCPGIRIGWICAHKSLIEQYLLLKNNVDLASPAITQRQMSDWLDHYDLDAHINSIIELYEMKRDVMAEAFKKDLPPQVVFEIPQGGLFLWCQLPDGCDAEELLRLALDEESVVFVPGVSFYPNAERHNEFRCNYSCMDPDEIREGSVRLGRAIRKYLAQKGL